MSQCLNQFGKVWTAHWVENDTCTLTISDTHHFLQHVILFCGNDMGRPGLDKSIPFRRRTRESYGRCPSVVSELNGSKANTAGCSRNDNEVAFSHLGICNERTVSRQLHHPDR